MEISVDNGKIKRAFSGLKYAILSLLLIAAASLLISCGPDKITVSPVTVSPSTVTPGQKVSVGINILNLEKKAVTGYVLNFSVKGVVTETKTVTLEAGQTTTITFEYIPDTTGNYTVDVNGQTGTFTVVRPANFIVGEISSDPQSPVLGQEIMVSTDITNDGEMPGTYNALFKLDGSTIKTGDLELEAGQSLVFTANFTANTSGLHVLEFGAITKTIKVLKPAEFKSISIDVSPSSVLIGNTATVTAEITNEGDVAGTFPVALKVNGTESSSKSISLEPGAKTIVDFSVSPSVSGSMSLQVLGSTTTLNVIGLKTYSQDNFFYKISYPADYEINEIDTTTTQITKNSNATISILVDKVTVASTAKDYFDAIAGGKKEQLPDWTFSSLTEVKENGEIIGYKYDYSNTVEGNKWTGKGMVIKKGGLGFYVVFTTLETEWDKNKGLAPRILESFISPNIFNNQYKGTTTGITLTLPPEWTAIETGLTQQPLVLIRSNTDIGGAIGFDAIAADMTSQQYVDASIAAFKNAGWTVNSKGPFNFDDATVGYQAVLAGSTPQGTFKFIFISLISGSKAYSTIFIGLSPEMDAHTGAMTQMVKSLVITSPESGLNKNETLSLLEGEVPTLDPALTEEAPEGIIGAIFSGLVRIDKNLKIVPDLAERWTVSTDGKVYTFSLRKNAKFHSGKQVTAADVKYSWERACDPALKAPKAVYFLNDIVGAQDMIDGKATEISGIKIIDDYTLEVTIDAAKQYFLHKLAQPIAYIVNSTNVARGDKWYETPDGTGPFTLKLWQKDSQIILERYEDFYEGPVKLKNIVFKIFAGIPMTLYETGEIDITGVSVYNQDRVLNPSDPLNKQLLTGTVASFDYVGFNVTKPPFDDVKVRQAFAMALDVDKLLEISLKGRASRAAGYVPQGVPAYNSSLSAIAYDVDQAKQLIAESKYQSINNFPEIKFYALYGTSSLDEAIIGMWQQNLGVKVTVETISEIKTYFDRLRNHDFQVFVSGWRADYLDPQNFLEVLFRSHSTENHFAYSNTHVDELLVQAGIDANEQSRIQKYQEIEKLILEDLPAIPLFRNDKDYVLVKPWVKGYTVLPLGTGQWRDIYIEVH